MVSSNQAMHACSCVGLDVDRDGDLLTIDQRLKFFRLFGRTVTTLHKFSLGYCYVFGVLAGEVGGLLRSLRKRGVGSSMWTPLFHDSLAERTCACTRNNFLNILVTARD